VKGYTERVAIKSWVAVVALVTLGTVLGCGSARTYLLRYSSPDGAARTLRAVENSTEEYETVAAGMRSCGEGSPGGGRTAPDNCLYWASRSGDRLAILRWACDRYYQRPDARGLCDAAARVAGRWLQGRSRSMEQWVPQVVASLRVWCAGFASAAACRLLARLAESNEHGLRNEEAASFRRDELTAETEAGAEATVRVELEEEAGRDLLAHLQRRRRDDAERARARTMALAQGMQVVNGELRRFSAATSGTPVPSSVPLYERDSRPASGAGVCTVAVAESCGRDYAAHPTSQRVHYCAAAHTAECLLRSFCFQEAGADTAVTQDQLRTTARDARASARELGGDCE
jgi:hypothetical protein